MLVPPGFDKAMADLHRLAASFSPKGMNIRPFRDSWTAGQLVDHLLRSNLSINQALLFPGKATDRPAAARAGELEQIFMDFSVKFEAPDFIAPGCEVYRQDSLLASWQQSLAEMRALAQQVDLASCITHEAFGEITRLELLYFVDYHTRRHTHQLHQIYTVVEQGSYKMLSFLFQPPSLFE